MNPRRAKANVSTNGAAKDIVEVAGHAPRGIEKPNICARQSITTVIQTACNLSGHEITSLSREGMRVPLFRLPA